MLRCGSFQSLLFVAMNVKKHQIVLSGDIFVGLGKWKGGSRTFERQTRKTIGKAIDLILAGLNVFAEGFGNFLVCHRGNDHGWSRLFEEFFACARKQIEEGGTEFRDIFHFVHPDAPVV